MNELALFAGAGGGILGGKLLGWRTVCAVEFASYPRSVLLARQRDGSLPKFPIWDDVQTFDGNPWRGVVDVVSGGFPCQDISAAGGGAGIDGERSGLWVEMARIIREVQPRFAFVENSPMLTSRGLGRVLGDLAEMGFDARWGVVSAAHAGAPHLRERIWILAYTNGKRLRIEPERTPIGRLDVQGCGEAAAIDDGAQGVMANTDGDGEHAEPFDAEVAIASTNVANAGRGRRGGSVEGQDQQSRRAETVGASSTARTRSGRKDVVANAERMQREPGYEPAMLRGRSNEAEQTGMGGSGDDGGGWWIVEPDVGRVADGVASRMDRLAAIGNGQVPAVVRLAWQTLIGTDPRILDEPAE